MTHRTILALFVVLAITATAYFSGESAPKFYRKECILRVDYTFTGADSEDARGILIDLFSRYLRAQEPRIAGIGYQSPPGSKWENSFFVQFADQCDRRYEIGHAVANHINNERPDLFRITASDDLILPGPDTIEMHGEEIWIDGRPE